MKKTKKQMVAAGLALVMAVSLVGCGNSGGDSQKEDGQITLKFSFDQGVGEATQKIVDKFNESQDKIKVETVLLPQDANQVHDDFVNKLASGDKSVDIMGLDVVYVAEFASAGWLMDLTNKIDTDAMLDGPVEGATYDGKLVAAPWFTNSSVLFYRQDVLEQLGAEVPTTYEGWMELADQAVGINGIEYGADFQAAQSEALVTNWVEYVWNNGGDVLDESGDPVINSENNVEATNIMKKLVDEYEYDIDIKKVDLIALEKKLNAQKDLVINLITNPMLIEHEEFSDMLMSILHLREELSSRCSHELEEYEIKHLAKDINVAYKYLTFEWIQYMKQLKANYPQLFLKALITNPFDKRSLKEKECSYL